MNTVKAAEGIDARKEFCILLLTNRDSDNVGDQIIELCDISLIRAVMENLGVKEEEYKIVSRPARIVSKKYVATKDPALLATAEKAIRKADLLVFGGAPLFNFDHQILSERTATTLDLAQKCGIPVIFSAIGVEGYSEQDVRCQRLKKTLNYDCVKQITTRDDLDGLRSYVEQDRIVTGKVSDPAVLSARVFEKYIQPAEKREKKKIGLFVLRASGFSDNGVDFPFESAVRFWTELIRALEKKGYDYEVLSSGHFGDEAVIDYLVRNKGVSEKKCVFNMNRPEDLIARISSYDAVVSCRLHPIIVSYALKVPSVGLVWNRKVRLFYEDIGCGDRAIPAEDFDSGRIMEKLEKAMSEGVEHEEEYLSSVYRCLFQALKREVRPESAAEPYAFHELIEHMPVYEGTSEKEYEEKLKRKFRRAYEQYNINGDNLRKLRKQSVLRFELSKLKEKLKRFPGVYRKIQKILEKTN